jgi:[histone H3]-lysine36 N-dimethyltransferase SETMAR
MQFSRRDIKVISIHEFSLGRTATEAKANICRTIGEATLSLHTLRLWFRRFKNRDFSLDDKPRSGRPVDLDVADLKALIESDPRQTTRCLAEQLGCSHTTIERHLSDLGKTYRYGVWIPHQLTRDQFERRVDACLELLSSRRNFEWLNNLITGDEKWVLYVNHTCKRQWLSPGDSGIPTPNKELHPKKIMLSVWWGPKGIVHWELLPNGRTVTAEVYCQQLDRVAASLKKKQDRVYFLHDNARPHVALATKKKIMELNWTVLPHPPYSPDLAPTDYHLFRSLANHVNGKSFDDKDALKQFISDFFTSKSPEFYRDGILSLPERWQWVVDNSGAYYS